MVIHVFGHVIIGYSERLMAVFRDSDYANSGNFVRGLDIIHLYLD